MNIAVPGGPPALELLDPSGPAFTIAVMPVAIFTVHKGHEFFVH